MESHGMSERLAATVTPPELPIAEALARLQDAGTGMLLIASADRKLIGVLTDGDVRRHILAGGTLDQPCGSIAWPDPIVATEGLSPDEALALMDHGREFPVHHLPLLGADRVIKGLWLRSDFVSAAPSPLSAVIMAGGFGTRLRPLTEHMPKPMLPVGDRPLLERTIERLRHAGIQDVGVTTHYLGDRITSHFGDGHAFGVDITYVSEDRPLGTAGVLRPTPRPRPGRCWSSTGTFSPTSISATMLAFHREHGADATVGGSEVRACRCPTAWSTVDRTTRARTAGEAHGALPRQRGDLSPRALGAELHSPRGALRHDRSDRAASRSNGRRS